MAFCGRGQKRIEQSRDGIHTASTKKPILLFAGMAQSYPRLCLLQAMTIPALGIASEEQADDHDLTPIEMCPCLNKARVRLTG